MSRRTASRSSMARRRDRGGFPANRINRKPSARNPRMKTRFRPRNKSAARRPAPRAVPTQPGFEQFNLEVPERFPQKGMLPRAAQAVVNSEAWTDASPMLNLSSFVTTFTEPEEMEVLKSHFTKNYI